MAAAGDVVAAAGVVLLSLLLLLWLSLLPLWRLWWLLLLLLQLSLGDVAATLFAAAAVVAGYLLTYRCRPLEQSEFGR